MNVALNRYRIFRIASGVVFVGALVLGFPKASGAEEYFDRYDLSPASPAVDLGGQPLGYPSGVISAVMARDRILQKSLADLKRPLKVHAFRRGADMVGLLGDHRLEAGLIGDMPTIITAAAGQVWIVGLVKQTSTAIVARGITQTSGLAGKRIGYVPTSSAHHTLLQGLASAGLDENSASLVALQIDEMPDALERGEIDAFAAWEPGPSIALVKSDKNRIVFRGLSSDYFVMDRDFAKRSPQGALLLVAGFLRSLEWMRRAPANTIKAAAWAMADAATMTGKPTVLTAFQIAAITRREILDVPSAPAIPLNPANMPLHNEYRFLAQLGKLPAGASLENLRAAFAYDGLSKVMSDPRTYQTGTFDYAD
jgi:NitT/TauT family transport system substrate-binding protein